MTLRVISAATQEAGLYPPIGDTIAELEQMRQDAVVSAAMDELLGPIRSAVNASASLHDTHGTIELICTALWRGFAVAAITRASKIHTCALDPDSVSLELNADATPRAVHWTIDGKKDILHHGQYLCARWRPSPANPFGISLLRPAVRPWRARDRILNLWGQSIQRAGHPMVIASVPPGTPAATINAVRAELDDLSVTTTAVLPSDVTIQAIQPTYATTVSHAEIIAYLDASIRRAITLRDSGSSILAGKILETGTSVAARDSAPRARCAEIAAWINQTLRSADLPIQNWPAWLTALSPEREYQS